MTKSRARKAANKGSGQISKRAKGVWLALVAAMTGVGGMLLMVDGRPASRGDGIALPPLVSTGTPSSAESIIDTRKGVSLDRNRWKSIVIHHSGSVSGSPSAIEQEHLKQRFKGLGHHFVIGNGRGMEDGEVHVGYRWLDQLPGAHAGGSQGPWFNNHAISICLVGDGDRQAFSKAQLARLDQLVAALCAELKIAPDQVVLHSSIAQTSDPGRLFPEAWLREQLRAAR
ncbi:MAG: peptidoglycan recognition protein family protein [Phycisphaerales bacterium]